MIMKKISLIILSMFLSLSMIEAKSYKIEAYNLSNELLYTFVFNFDTKKVNIDCGGIFDKDYNMYAAFVKGNFAAITLDKGPCPTSVKDFDKCDNFISINETYGLVSKYKKITYYLPKELTIKKNYDDKDFQERIFGRNGFYKEFYDMVYEFCLEMNGGHNYPQGNSGSNNSTTNRDLPFRFESPDVMNIKATDSSKGEYKGLLNHNGGLVGVIVETKTGKRPEDVGIEYDLEVSPMNGETADWVKVVNSHPNLLAIEFDPNYKSSSRAVRLYFKVNGKVYGSIFVIQLAKGSQINW